jgi:hypothetical protein
MEEIKKEVEAWEDARNNKNARINWKFTTNNARIKLRNFIRFLMSDIMAGRLIMIFIYRSLHPTLRNLSDFFI